MVLASSLLALLATAAIPAFAAPAPQEEDAAQLRPGPKKCTKPSYIRKEWRTLEDCDKELYISAVKCLMKKKGTVQMSAVRSRFDDFIATHQAQTDFVHFVGIFYPYHRLLLHEYEKALWSCGWKRELGQPYWDWTKDVATKDAFLNSPVFSKTLGFGGNGDFIPGNLSNPQVPGHIGGPPFDLPDRSGGGCLKDGPFVGTTTLLGPQNITTNTTPRCIRRDFSYNSLRDLASPARIQEAMAIPKYGDFEFVTDTQSFHPAGHWAVGGLYGMMTDTYTSPADPIFYLHHSNVDRAWTSWQKRDLVNREKDISGPLVFFDYANQFAGNATLDTPVWVGLTGRVEFKAGELLSPNKGPFCYAYDSLY